MLDPGSLALVWAAISVAALVAAAVIAVLAGRAPAARDAPATCSSTTREE